MEDAIRFSLPRIAGFALGFALWTVFAFAPWEGVLVLREGWDRSSYWTLGVPFVFAAQTALGVFSDEPLLRQPLPVIIGHCAAMILFSPPGTGLGLLPVAIVFIGVPAYLMLLFAATLGHVFARIARRSA